MRICLCGSTKFKEEYIKTNRVLSLAGHTVYSVATFGHQPGEELTEDQKILLDMVHLNKILESDAIFLVGKADNGMPYVGDSTRREIAWAWFFDKEVFYVNSYDDIHQHWIKWFAPDQWDLPAKNNTLVALPGEGQGG